jgi:transposase
MSRYDLTDFEWRVIGPLLPNKPRGASRVDDHRVLLLDHLGPRTIVLADKA